MIIKERGKFRIEKNSYDGLIITERFGDDDWCLVFGNKNMNPTVVYKKFEELTKN